MYAQDMHSGLTHWELSGLGLFGKGAQRRNAAGSQDKPGPTHSWQCVLETVGLSH